MVGDTENPLVWYVGERQFDILTRRDGATRTLLYSAEGGGKTVLMAQWLILQVVLLAQAGDLGAIGATAPTHERLMTLAKAVTSRCPSDTARDPRPGSWARWFSDDRELRFATGHVIQFRSTKRQSDATGSPVQGFTWKASGDDELQDTAENGADPDIEMRLRGARVSRRMCTATAKDSPTWRSFRDGKLSSPNWRIERIRYDETPFVWPEHWARARQEMSPREWARRGLAQDVGPERMTYTTWDRDRNLRPVPDIGAEDVTARVLHPWGGNLAVLAGHDPGKLVDVTLLLKAYQLVGRPKHDWWVVGELTTPQTTTEQHVVELLKLIRGEPWRCNELDWRGKPVESGRRIFVRADPYSDSGNDAQHPDKSVYTVFRKHGIAILPGAMKAVGTESRVAAVPKEGGIDMVCRLFCNADGDRRLFVACDARRQPAAPRLVEAIELSERDGDGKAEQQRKDKRDLSHWMAALRYALWQLEKPSVGMEQKAG